MAVTLLVQQLAYALRLAADVTDTIEEPQLTVLNGLLASATALVQQYAVRAPDAIHNEAAIRLAGFLYDVPPGANRRQLNPMRDSGAVALLSSYRVQRAVALEDDGAVTSAPRGFALVGNTQVQIAVSGVWTATGVTKPSTPWFAYQVAIADEITPVLLIAPDSLDQSTVAGETVDVAGGMKLGCAASGELMIAHSSIQAVTLRVWSVNL